MRRLKILIAVVFIIGTGIAISGDVLGFPAFLPKARKFGAKDCTFCHVNPEGGEPWNERGQWLVDEKNRRKADVVDPMWLADYKPGKAGQVKGETKTETAAPPPQVEQGGKTAESKKIDPKIYDDYVGQYELPIFVLNITKEGDRLFGQPGGDTKEELIPESETEFKVTNVNGKIKFVKDDKGKVTHMVVTLSGETFEGKKIK